MGKRILVGYAPKNHVKLAFDEIEGLRDLGFTCQPVVYGRNNQSITVLNKVLGVVINAIKVRLVLHKFKPDIIYLNSRFEPVASTRDAISIFIFKILYFRRVKLVIKSHGSDLSCLENGSFLVRKIVLPFLTKKVDQWLFLSEEERRYMQSSMPNIPAKFQVTSNIVDPRRSIRSADFRSRFKMSDNKFAFLFAGRMVRVKGIFTIIEAISQFEFRDRALFYFVGDGPDLNELKERAKSLGVDECVKFTGFIEDDVCDHFYANVDALIFPTFDSEGFPMVLFKAVASGLPIVTTKIRAACDHLVSPKHVLWVNGESVDDVKRAMTEIYLNPELRKTMSESNASLGKRFSRSEVVSQMERMFSAL